MREKFRGARLLGEIPVQTERGVRCAIPREQLRACDGALANMAPMDMAEIAPLLRALAEQSERLDAAPVRRAMENLRTVLRTALDRA